MGIVCLIRGTKKELSIWELVDKSMIVREVHWIIGCTSISDKMLDIAIKRSIVSCLLSLWSSMLWHEVDLVLYYTLAYD